MDILEQQQGRHQDANAFGIVWGVFHVGLALGLTQALSSFLDASLACSS
jgi:hypothetical protein